MNLLFFVREKVEAALEGVWIERALNEAAKRGIRLYRVKRFSRLRAGLVVLKKDFASFCEAAEKYNVAVTVTARRGPWQKVLGKKKYAVLYAAVFIAAVAAIAMSRFIWFIRIVGSENIRTEDIMGMLNESGIKAGMKKSDVDFAAIERTLMIGFDELSYVGTDISGIILTVTVKEGLPIPELNEKRLGDIVAKKDAYIESIEVYSGRAAVIAGQTVLKGQTLISGQVSEGVRFSPRGKIVAYVWTSAAASAPLYEKTYIPTGNSCTSKKLILGRLESGGKCAYEHYIEHVQNVSVLGARLVCPVKIVTISFTETAEQSIMRNIDEVIAEASEASYLNALKLIEDGAQVISAKTYLTIKGGMLYADTYIKTEEDICRYIFY